MVDSVYRTRSLGVAAEGLPDQYADGRAAKVWHYYIGDKRSRTDEYRNWILSLLQQHNCHTVLDVACGTGVDSEMLVEEGFSVVSVDASDKMLKYALKTRWNRRKEPAFDKWGDQSDHRLALSNIAGMVRPGGIFIIDHRNYDYILSTGCAPQGKNIYYKSDLTQDITTSVLWVNNKPHMVTLDYTVQVPTPGETQPELSKFRLSYYPHRLDTFSALLHKAFGGKCEHKVYGDFLPYNPGQDTAPCYFIHVVKKTA
ncbi:glycine N-methyltransferase [Bombina bombina]|uniref:glycine N-methyltransferase n=1 Tax=Bombina bombina TaxID=8345 RepID=UPI00235A4D36|nr:glycine N-methyltransferase [Bombina bombina]